MLVLTVISYNGNLADPLSAHFDERGGAIGRADSNHLVLPDSERTVSRVHAQVVFRNGQYYVVDHGSNPIAVNGRELGRGREQAIVPGDSLQIGGYLLSIGAAARATSGAQANDPFADLFASSPPPQPAPAPAPIVSPPPVANPPARGHAMIPDDWDPFQSVAKAGGPAAPPAMPQLVPDRHDSLENLFQLQGAPAADPLGANPGALGLARPGAAIDNLYAPRLPQHRAPSAPPVRDDVSDLQTPWADQTRTQGDPRVPAGAVLSWEQTVPGEPVRPAPSPAAVAPIAPAAQVPRAKAPNVMPPVSPPPAPVLAATVPQQAATTATESEAVAALLAAFLEGVDVPALQVDALTPSFMFRLGALLRESTRGTVDLMVARAALKREVRAQMTVIAMRENNPLKFSPTADIALQHLLGPLENGFTPPIAAVQDAYDDLRAHQVGMVAGMRAALEGVLARFDPARLETQLTPRAGLAGLLPSNRQARLWEAFEALHAQLATEAEDAFHELFGAAFLQAYEAHIDSIKRELKHE